VMNRRTSDNIIFDTIAIVGVGLIGGSIGMAAKRRGLARRVIGIGRTEQKLMRAKILAAIDDYSLDMATGASEAELVVICTPVKKVVPTIAAMVGSLKKGVVVTDVGSTKAAITERAETALGGERRFVGGHPMAGSEKTGVEAASADLFVGATWVLTPTEKTDLEALGKMTAFVDALGARVEAMTPRSHDAAVAVISHLPHVIAGAVLAAAEEAHRETGQVMNLAAGSFRDLTRIADSSPEIWRDICDTNRQAIVDAIDLFASRLLDFRNRLTDGDESLIEDFFESSRRTRETYLRMTK